MGAGGAVNVHLNEPNGEFYGSERIHIKNTKSQGFPLRHRPPGTINLIHFFD